MPNQKTMDELLANFSDNDTGAITPGMLRDFVVSTIGATGWADYTDSTYTTGSPQSLPAGVATKVENDGATKQEQELPFGISSLWDPVENAIPALVAGSGIILTFETTIRRVSGTGRWEFDAFIDIGIPVELFVRSIALDNGTDDKHITFSTGAYTLNNWVTNGGSVYIRPEVEAVCHSSRILVHQIHRGRGTY